MISIIVPCYNVENYIDRCMESLVNQTIGIDNLEIILVNDASTDDTLAHLQEWEREYPDNIMVITYDENLRQGGARNVGLSYARGEYIGFVDSDDWIEPVMYEALYKALTETDSDLARCKYIRDDGKIAADRGNVTDKKHIAGGRNGNLYGFEIKDCNFIVVSNEKRNDLCYMKKMVDPAGSDKCGTYGGITTMLFKRELIFDNNIFFPEKIAYEDNYWLGVMQLYIEKVSIIDKPLYHYYINTDSTTTEKNAARHLERLQIEEMLLEEYQKRGAFEAFYDKILMDFLQRYYLNTYHIFFTRFTDIPDVYGHIYDTVNLYFEDWVSRLNALNPNIIGHSRMLQLLANKSDSSVKEVLEAYIKDNGIELQ